MTISTKQLHTNYIMKTITKQNLSTSRDKINAALKTLGEELGVQFHAGNCRFDMDKATFKLEMAIIPEDGKSVAEVQFEKDKMRVYGMSNILFGQTFFFQGETFTVAGVKPRSRKYPLLGKCERRNKTFKFNPEWVEFV